MELKDAINKLDLMMDDLDEINDAMFDLMRDNEMKNEAFWIGAASRTATIALHNIMVLKNTLKSMEEGNG